MDWSRREILTAFLGAPFALAACGKPAPVFPSGEFVGQNADLGHVLREGRSFEVPAKKWRTVKVAVIGAGIAGLTAAWQLSRKGIRDHVIVELEREAGGTSRSGKGDLVPYPWGAHYLPIPFPENTDLIGLLDEMGLTEGRTAAGDPIIKEQFLCREPEERIFFKGRWYDGLYAHIGESDEDVRQFGEFQNQIDMWVDRLDAAGRRYFVVPSAKCSDDAEAAALDKISFAEWLLRHGFTSERLVWYCDYACRDDYGLTLDQTSAWAGLFYFCSRVKKGGEESQQFITFPEGNGRFVEHLRMAVRDRIISSHAAVRVVPTESGADVICFNGTETMGFHSEKVIFAAPVFTAPFVIEGFRDASPFNAAAFEHNSWFVANLFLKNRPQPRFARDFPLSWDNVLYDSPSLGYVNATHQAGIDHGPVTLTYYYPMCREENFRTKLFEYSWKELADVCLSDLSRAHPDIYELTERIDIMRWGHAMISPRPGFIHGGERQKALQPFGNIHFAHTDLSGIALFEEAFYHGIRAATEISFSGLRS